MSTVHLKKQAAEAAAKEIKDGMIVGLGTGSTADFATRFIHENNLDVRGVPTSKATEKLAAELGIELLSCSEVSSIDILIDGADECTLKGEMIKGGGGALLREKMIASIAKRRLYVMDESKLVESLGAFPLPIEVNQFGWEIVQQKLEEIGIPSELRLQDGQRFVTDNGNLIFDCQLKRIDSPYNFEGKIKKISGIVESGLFLGIATEIFIAGSSGLRHIICPPSDL